MVTLEDFNLNNIKRLSPPKKDEKCSICGCSPCVANSPNGDICANCYCKLIMKNNGTPYVV